MSNDPFSNPLSDIDDVAVAAVLADASPGGRAQHLVGASVPDAWLFPPVVIDGAAVYLISLHDIDLSDAEERVPPALLVSAPLGHVIDDGESAEVTWRSGCAPDEISEGNVPTCDRDVISEALQLRPVYAQHALSSELAALADQAAAGNSVAPARLATLFDAVVPAWAVDEYRSLGADIPARSGRMPLLDPDYLEASFVSGLGDPEQTILCLEGHVAAAARSAGIDVSAQSPLAGADAIEDGPDLPAGVVASLAAPDFVIRVDGLAGAGRLSLTVAVSTIEGVTHWTGISALDGAAVVMPNVSGADLAQLVAAVLDTNGLAEAPMLRFPMDALRMATAAAVADAHGVVGASAFQMDLATAQEWVDAPSATGLAAAIGALASLPRPVLADGFGDPDFLGVANGALSLDAMVKTYARRLDDLQGHLAVSLTDFGLDSGPATFGHCFFVADGHLWTASPEGGWGAGGLGADQRVDLVTLDAVDMERLIGLLIGQDPGERLIPAED